MKKRWILLSVVAVALLVARVSAADTIDTSNTINILFGSCSHQDKPMPIFNAILSEPKDAFFSR